ncbi:hypothetical protein IW146_006914, partial [Coemansia sp. RSA 922]
VRPQLRQGVTYRSYVGPSTTAAAAMVERGHVDEDGAEYGKEGGVTDPYSYDLPEYDNQGQNPSPNPNPKAGGQQPGAGYAPAVTVSPPPYSIAPQDAQVLPPRTDGTYSSSYEHTAAWVQGSASHTTGSESGAGAGPTHAVAAPAAQQYHQQSPHVQPLQPQQQVFSQQQPPTSQYQQPPVSQYQPASQAPAAQYQQYQPPVSQYQTPASLPPPGSQYQQTPPPPAPQQPQQQYQQTPPPPQQHQQQHGPY